MNIKLDILFSNQVPIISLLIAVIIFLSDFINLNKFRKVSVKKRKANKNLFDRYVEYIAIPIFSKVLIYEFFFRNKRELIELTLVAEQKEIDKKAHYKLMMNIIMNILITIAIYLKVGMWTERILLVALILAVQVILDRVKLISKKKLIKKQFYYVIREFIEGYSIYNNVSLAFQYSIKEVDNVYSVLIQNLVKELNTASKREEALNKFYKKLDNEIAAGFISIIKSSYVDNTGITEALIEYQDLSRKLITREERKDVNLRRVRTNLIFWMCMCVVVMIGVGTYLKTGIGNYYLTTIEGQGLAVVGIIAMLFGGFTILITSDK